MTSISWWRWPQFAVQLLQMPHKYQVWGKSYPSDGFCISQTLLCNISYCIFLESAKHDKLENKLWSNFPNGRDSLTTWSWNLQSQDHFFEPREWMNENNGACNGIAKISHFNRCLGSIVISKTSQSDCSNILDQVLSWIIPHSFLAILCVFPVTTYICTTIISRSVNSKMISRVLTLFSSK